MIQRLVAIAGCGWASQAIHVPALLSLPARFRIVGVDDGDPARARAVAQRLGVPTGLGDAEAVVVARAEDLPEGAVQGRHVVTHRTVALAGNAASVTCMDPITYDPAWQALLELAPDDVQLIDLRFRVGPVVGARTTQPTVSPPPEERLAAAEADAATALAQLGWLSGVPVCQRVVPAPADERRIDLVGVRSHVTVELSNPTLFGHNSRLRRWTSEGISEPGPVQENGWRRAWKALHDDLESVSPT